MPQNWWEIFPEVLPSPSARSRPLPGPGGVMPSRAMGFQPALPNAGFDPGQPPTGAFDPAYFSGGAFTGDEPPARAPVQSPFSGANGAVAMDRTAAIQHAAAAIQSGADPDAVRARLHDMGHADLDPSSPFSDLIPDGRQALGMIGASGMPMPAERSTSQEGGFDESSYPAPNPQQYRGNLQRRSDPTMAPQKADGPRKYPQSTVWGQVNDRVNEVARAAFGLVNSPSGASLTSWQRRRRAENEAALNDPRIRAFLDMISFSEGNTNYGSLFGNHHQTFTDRSTHPGNRGENFHGRPGGASGRYQIMPGTYQDLNARLGPYTMSDADQDMMAIEIIRERGALPLITSGHLDEAISRLGRSRQWTSFPILENGTWRRNPSNQFTRNIEDLRARYAEALTRNQREGLAAAGRRATRN